MKNREKNIRKDYLLARTLIRNNSEICFVPILDALSDVSLTKSLNLNQSNVRNTIENAFFIK